MVLNGEERFIALQGERFRILDWPGAEGGAPVVLLHGLGDVADVWGPVVEALGDRRGRVVALEQRGHGQSPEAAGRGGASALRLVRDVLELFAEEGLERPHLVGHSMGGRIAMVLAARRSEVIRSVAIIDIGPEAWAANCEESVEAVEERPARFADRAEALAYGGRRRALTPADEELFMTRLRRSDDGSFGWLGSAESMIAIVRTQRLRNYWRDWEALRVPALFVRGGRTREVRERIADRMRVRNPSVEFVEIAESSHNVPLRAPARLAAELGAFWDRILHAGSSGPKAKG